MASHNELTPANRPMGNAPIPKLILKPSIPKGYNRDTKTIRASNKTYPSFLLRFSLLTLTLWSRGDCLPEINKKNCYLLCGKLNRDEEIFTKLFTQPNIMTGNTHRGSSWLSAPLP